MNLQELTAIVARGELEQTEFKTTTGERIAGVRTVCAMLNGQGGFVFFGVSDAGQIRGQLVTAQTQEDMAQELRKLEPPSFPEMELIALDNGNTVIVLRVTGGGGPYTYDGRPYMRVGPTTVVMPQDRYERMLLERMHASARWENRPAQGLGIIDLDEGEIKRTIDASIASGRMEDPGTRDITELLTGLNLIYNGQLLNAAVVLFGKANRLLPNYPQCLLRMARFRGRDKTEFIDNRQEVGHAFDLFQRAQRFMRDHLPVAGRIVPNLFERVDDPLYPPAALREALANALCHRDYSIGGGAISVGIYDDRLEISSIGTLPFGLTPADLTRPHQSRPWNPLIANVFYRRGIIESWGRGTIKMAELTEQAGLAPPEFEVAAGEVTVRFRPTRYVPPMRVGHDLSPLQRDLLEVLERIGPASLSQVMHVLPTSTPEPTVKENLRVLKLLDLTDHNGKMGRNSRWMLKGAQA
jgi:ATP-dependent DNA helicase RecG